MAQPTLDQFWIAIHWLENNEGEGEEGEACKAVAEWLLAETKRRMVRQIAREAGCTNARARAFLKQKGLL